MRHAIAAFTIALLVGATSLAQDGVRIGIIDLVSDTVPEAETRILSNRLRIELVRTGEFTVIERERMNLILEEQGFQMSGCVATECAVEMGQLLGAETMVVGNIDKLGDVYTISLRLVDVETGAVDRVAVQDCECELQDVLTSTIARTARELAGIATTQITGGTSRSPAVPIAIHGAPAVESVEQLIDRQRGSLSSGGLTQYELQIPSRTAIEIRVDKGLNSSLDPLVRVVDSNNNEVGRDDDGGNGLNSLLSITLARGNYTVVVQAVGSSSGDFVLAINEVRARSISLGNSATGTLSSGGRDVYSFRVDRALDYQFSVEKQTGSGLDPKVTVLGSGGNEIGSNDDGGEGNNALLLTRLTPGEYTIAVTAYGTTSGGYLLSVGEPDIRNVGDLRMNSSVSGSITRAAERQTYRLRVTTAGTVTIDFMKVTGSNIDPELQLRYSGGDVIESNDDGGEGLNSRISRHLSVGEYEVVVFSHNSNSGPYTLSASGPGGSRKW